MQGFPPLGPADEEAVASLLQDAKEERCVARRRAEEPQPPTISR